MTRTYLRLAPFLLALTTCTAANAVAQPPNRGERPDADHQRALTEYQQGWSAMRSEDFDGAVTSFQRALDFNPKMNLAYYGLGRAYLALRRYQEAVRALATCRDNYVAQAGQKFAGQTDANQARQDRLTELRDLQSQYSRGPQNAQTADVQRQIQNAIRETTDQAARGVNISIDASVPAFVSLSLGSAYFRAEQMENAEKEFKKAIAADSKSGEAHNNLAVIYFLTNRAPLAQAEIKAAEKSGFRVNPDFKQQVKEAVGR